MASKKSGKTDAFSKRWNNLEEYINNKKSKRDRDEGMSKGEEIAGEKGMKKGLEIIEED